MAPSVRELLAVALVYLGLGLAGLGLAGLAWARLRGPRGAVRGRAARWLAAGLVSLLAGFGLPPRERRVAREASLLDRFLPASQFGEFHELHVAASPERVYRSIHAVTADEILLFRTLTYLRRFGRPGPESILNAPERLPLLEVATRTTFLLLAEDPGREIVVGTLVLAPRGFRPRAEASPEDFRTLDVPGFAKAAMNFRVEPEAGGTRLSTETRVFATDRGSARGFARYWRVIYPGSALIRRMWLRAVRRRAEREPQAAGGDALGEKSRVSP